MAEQTTITLSDCELFKKQCLIWSNQFRVVCLLTSNNYTVPHYPAIDWVLAVDAISEIRCPEQSSLQFSLYNLESSQAEVADSFEKFKRYYNKETSTIYGFFSYDLKNETEAIESTHEEKIGFPELYFFRPRYEFKIEKDKLTVNRNYPETFALLEMIRNVQVPPSAAQENRILKSRTIKSEYIENICAIKKQIESGDFYELNYCNEFYSDNVPINPVDVFLALNDKAKAPFSCFMKLDESYLLCASPERFLKKQSKKLIAQPMKGTIKQSQNRDENRELQLQLKNNLKERAENVMIVDLMRNDLSKSAVSGTVKVEELFGVYEFPTVNQMISTITAQIDPHVHPIDAVRHAFPMGSMTGAPKVEVMKNIDRYENFKRGLYSGAVGYINTCGDFDFNVAIRVVLFNAQTNYLSLRVGGAITYDSDPQMEWDEIILKAENLLEVLNASIN